jgi:hypothetical protein
MITGSCYEAGTHPSRRVIHRRVPDVVPVRARRRPRRLAAPGPSEGVRDRQGRTRVRQRTRGSGRLFHLLASVGGIAAVRAPVVPRTTWHVSGTSVVGAGVLQSAVSSAAALDHLTVWVVNGPWRPLPFADATGHAAHPERPRPESEHRMRNRYTGGVGSAQEQAGWRSVGAERQVGNAAGIGVTLRPMHLVEKLPSIRVQVCTNA